jgi:NADH:ubiquinone oxidoreductase subunit C
VQERKPSPEEIVDRLRQGLGEAFEYAFVENDRVICRVKSESWVDAVRFVREDSLLGCSFFSWLSAIDWSEEEIADAESQAAEESESSEESEGSDAQAPTGSAPEDPKASSAEGSPASVLSESTEKADTPPREPHEPDERGIAPYFQPAGELFELCCHLSSPGRGFGVTLKTALDKEQPSISSLTSVVSGSNWHERECHEMFGIDFEGHPNLAPLYLPEEFEGHPLRKSFGLGARAVKPWPGIVDVEEIPLGLEPTLEALARGEGEETQ